MTTTTFDTLAYSKTLQNAGIPQEQAEALATAQKQALDEMIAIKELAIQVDILRLENRMEANKHEIIKWLLSARVAQTAPIVAIIAFLK